MKPAEILWKRSLNACGMRYVNILSDGDAKTYQHVVSLNVYGSSIKILKEVFKSCGKKIRNRTSQ
jgi:hypothetical protein